MRAGTRTSTGRIGLAWLTILALSTSLGCGSDEDSRSPESQTSSGAQTSLEARPQGPAATEASPEAAAPPGETGELPSQDEAAVTAAVRSYIEGLDRHDAEAVCALFESGALPIRELPRRRSGCAASLEASLGYARPGGVPVWKKTTIEELKEVSVGPDRARVTASVVHQFADRKYPSVEDDVIYLDRAGDRWLLAKPSGTLYRAVGYPEPPLRALTPP